MKTAGIRKIGFVLALLALPQSAAFADTPVPSLNYWVQEAQKQVTFAPRPSLTVNLSVVGVDADTYGQLNVALSYDHNSQAQMEINALQGQFPGYQLSRAILDSGGPLTLLIPAIGMNQQVTVSVSPNGPWFDYTAYLTQAQTTALQKALQSDPNAVTVAGNVQASVPVQKVVEHVELGTDVCDTLVSGGQDLYSVMLKYAGVLQSIGGTTFQYTTTSDALKRSVLDSCIDISAQADPVSSFASLLAIPVAERTDKTKPVGETSQMVPSQVQLPVKYDLSIISGGAP